MKPYNQFRQGMRQVIMYAYRKHPAPVRVTNTNRGHHEALSRNGWVKIINGAAHLTEGALKELEDV